MLRVSESISKMHLRHKSCRIVFAVPACFFLCQISGKINNCYHAYIIIIIFLWGTHQQFFKLGECHHDIIENCDGRLQNKPLGDGISSQNMQTWKVGPICLILEMSD